MRLTFVFRTTDLASKQFVLLDNPKDIQARYLQESKPEVTFRRITNHNVSSAVRLQE
jgi:hypothetical protein